MSSMLWQACSEAGRRAAGCQGQPAACCIGTLTSSSACCPGTAVAGQRPCNRCSWEKRWWPAARRGVVTRGACREGPVFASSDQPGTSHSVQARGGRGKRSCQDGMWTGPPMHTVPAGRLTFLGGLLANSPRRLETCTAAVGGAGLCIGRRRQGACIHAMGAYTWGAAVGPRAVLSTAGNRCHDHRA